MKKFALKPIFKIAFVAVTLCMVSCSSDDNEDLVITDPDAEFDGELSVFESGNDNRDIVINSSAVSDDIIDVKVAFQTTTNSMRRLYISENVGGSGEVPFVFDSQEVDEKKDLSVDLKAENSNEFEFELKFPKLTTLTNGTVVYTIWTTTGRGDFRDYEKRNAFDSAVVGTVTVNYGNSNNTVNGLKSFTQTMLFAPLGDATSETFISLYNENVYRISEGEEFAALWDFGYYYGASGKASFASTADYPALFDTDGDGAADGAVTAVTNVPVEELNNFYFSKSTAVTTEDFDGITEGVELDFIVAPTSERVNNLEVNDVIEFEDNYGNKGLIKVTNIVGTDGSTGSITFDVKVQQ